MHVYVIPFPSTQLHFLQAMSSNTAASQQNYPWQWTSAQGSGKRVLRADLGPGYLRTSSALFLLEWSIHQRRESMLSWCNQLILRDLTSLSCSSIRISKVWSSTPGTWMGLRLPVPVELTFFSAEFLGSQDVANAEFLGGLRIMSFLFTCFLFLIFMCLELKYYC